MYITKKGWSTDKPSTKLDAQNIGPYKFLEIQGHSYVVDLPAYIKIGNVFHIDRLQKTAINLEGFL